MIDFNLPKLLFPIGVALALNLAWWIYPDLQDKNINSEKTFNNVSTIKVTV